MLFWTYVWFLVLFIEVGVGVCSFGGLRVEKKWFLWVSCGRLGERFRRGSRLFRPRIPVGSVPGRTAFVCSRRSLLTA